MSYGKGKKPIKILSDEYRGANTIGETKDEIVNKILDPYFSELDRKIDEYKERHRIVVRREVDKIYESLETIKKLAESLEPEVPELIIKKMKETKFAEEKPHRKRNSRLKEESVAGAIKEIYKETGRLPTQTDILKRLYDNYGGGQSGILKKIINESKGRIELIEVPYGRKKLKVQGMQVPEEKIASEIAKTLGEGTAEKELIPEELSSEAILLKRKLEELEKKGEVPYVKELIKEMRGEISKNKVYSAKEELIEQGLLTMERSPEGQNKKIVRLKKKLK